MTKPARKTQRQRTCRLWEDDEDCHLQQTYRRVRIVRHYEQRMSILPHALEALVHRHVLLWDLLRCVLATVLLAGHEVDRIYKKGGRPL